MRSSAAISALIIAILSQIGGSLSLAAPIVNKSFAMKNERSVAGSRGNAKAQVSANAHFRALLHEKDGSKIINDPFVKVSIEKLMGDASDNFWSHAQLSHEPVVSGSVLVQEACVRGLCTFMYAIFCVDTESNKCFVDYLDDTTDHVFGATCMKDLPAPLRKMLEERGHTIVFDHFVAVSAKHTNSGTSTNTTASKSKAKIAAEKVHLDSLAGTYEREGGTRFTDSTLEVAQLPAGKIAFNIQASNGAHTGGEEGTAELVKNHASYKREIDNGVSGSLEFEFRHGKVIITGDDQVFCGAGVTLLGTYKKTSD